MELPPSRSEYFGDSVVFGLRTPPSIPPPPQDKEDEEEDGAFVPSFHEKENYYCAHKNEDRASEYYVGPRMEFTTTPHLHCQGRYRTINGN